MLAHRHAPPRRALPRPCSGRAVRANSRASRVPPARETSSGRAAPALAGAPVSELLRSVALGAQGVTALPPHRRIRADRARSRVVWRKGGTVSLPCGRHAQAHVTRTCRAPEVAALGVVADHMPTRSSACPQGVSSRPSGTLVFSSRPANVAYALLCMAARFTSTRCSRAFSRPERYSCRVAAAASVASEGRAVVACSVDRILSTMYSGVCGVSGRVRWRTPMIAELVVALKRGQIKTGSPVHGERPDATCVSPAARTGVIFLKCLVV